MRVVVVRVVVVWLVVMGGVLGCEGSTQEPVPFADAAFPADFASHYSELKDCRQSHEHSLRHIRVFSNPVAVDAYLALSPEHPFVPGATLVKVEYDDPDCTELLGYTVMYREESGYAPRTHDWRWQELDAAGNLLLDGPGGGNIERCITCHTVHCAHSGGYELICEDDTGGG